jgi:hypothetical protein
MLNRTRREEIIFRHPLALTGWADRRPAGPRVQAIPVDPRELAGAQAAEAG